MDALDDPAIASKAVEALSKTILLFDARHDVAGKMKAGNKFAEHVVKSWAEAEWFTSRPKVPEKYSLCVSKVTSETNTDDAQDAWSRLEIPWHALAVLEKRAR